MYDANAIRQLINGIPTTLCTTTVNRSEDTDKNHLKWFANDYAFATRPSDTQEVSVPLIKGLLNAYHQVILEGPPGTSKSYFAKEVGRSYDRVIHVQFHPQYTYQNFVGGYVVEKTDVIYRSGVILNLLDDYDSNLKYLIVIDEFNRANVSQVLGEVIQCMDRAQSVSVEADGSLREISLPTNIHIIATLNTTDRTLGTIDYAIKRRFVSVYCAPEPRILIDLCPSANFISLCDFLTRLNKKLVDVTGSKDLTVGHAVFLSDNVKQGDKYVWGFEDFRILYNYKILPMIEDYCSNNREMVEDVVGRNLSVQLDGVSFRNAIYDFMEMIHD
jgi:5-methylcytosine-specific restriction protein B